METNKFSLKNELKGRDVREIQLRILDMETRISGIEKKGAKIKPIDLISTSFFATINSAIIVVSLLLIMLFKSKMF
jgi:hypothetical protein